MPSCDYESSAASTLTIFFNMQFGQPREGEGDWAAIYDPVLFLAWLPRSIDHGHRVEVARLSSETGIELYCTASWLI